MAPKSPKNADFRAEIGKNDVKNTIFIKIMVFLMNSAKISKNTNFRDEISKNDMKKTISSNYNDNLQKKIRYSCKKTRKSSRICKNFGKTTSFWALS